MNQLFVLVVCSSGCQSLNLPGGKNFGLRNVLYMKDVAHMSYLVAMTVPMTVASSRGSIS